MSDKWDTQKPYPTKKMCFASAMLKISQICLWNNLIIQLCFSFLVKYAWHFKFYLHSKSFGFDYSIIQSELWYFRFYFISQSNIIAGRIIFLKINILAVFASLTCKVFLLACNARIYESSKKFTINISELSCNAANASPVTRPSRLKFIKTSRTKRWNDKRGISKFVEFCNFFISLTTWFRRFGFGCLRLLCQLKEKEKHTYFSSLLMEIRMAIWFKIKTMKKYIEHVRVAVVAAVMLTVTMKMKIVVESV